MELAKRIKEFDLSLSSWR